MKTTDQAKSIKRQVTRIEALWQGNFVNFFAFQRIFTMSNCIVVIYNLELRMITEGRDFTMNIKCHSLLKAGEMMENDSKHKKRQGWQAQMKWGFAVLL